MRSYLFILFATASAIFAAGQPTNLEPPPRTGEIPVINMDSCWTGRERTEHGKRIAEIVFENGARLWLELGLDAPAELSPLCRQ